jgi:hypothetical protein
MIVVPFLPILQHGVFKTRMVMAMNTQAFGQGNMHATQMDMLSVG